MKLPYAKGAQSRPEVQKRNKERAKKKKKKEV